MGWHPPPACARRVPPPPAPVEGATGAGLGAPAAAPRPPGMPAAARAQATPPRTEAPHRFRMRPAPTKHAPRRTPLAVTFVDEDNTTWSVLAAAAFRALAARRGLEGVFDVRSAALDGLPCQRREPPTHVIHAARLLELDIDDDAVSTPLLHEDRLVKDLDVLVVVNSPQSYRTLSHIVAREDDLTGCSMGGTGARR